MKLVIPFVALAVGCSGHGSGPIEAVDAAPDVAVDAAVDVLPDVLSDAAPTPIIELLYRSADGEAIIVTDGAAVALTEPPQGGLVLLVGMRAKNLVGPHVDITASIRDTVDNQVLSLEQRPITVEADSAGWLVPVDASSFINWSNLPACPIAAATRDLHGQPYLLRVGVVDERGAMAEARLPIVPTCASGPDGDRCRCLCDADYVLGSGCP